MNGGVGMGMQNPRPPTGPPVRPGYNGPGPINMGQPGFNVRPVSAGPMRGGAPGQRPPIHLGRGGPPPALGFGGAPMRGVLADRGGRGRGVGIMPNVPRGPSGMRRPEPTRPSRARDSARGEREKERRKRDKGPEIKTTMTDFRIVGIEMKELGWSWGMVGVEDEVRKENGDASIEPTVEEDGSAVPDGEQDKKTGEEEEEAAVKFEPAESETADGVEEKRGEKRKAKTPDGGEHLVDPLAIRLIDLDDEAGSASKKRPSDYLLTHGKPNDTPPSTSHESNQNRFRIYFESPPELDRIPKAARRNPNKRWRRESSSVAPSRMGDGREETVTVDERAETATIDERAETATVDEVLEEVAGEDGTPVPQAGGETESAEVVAEESAEAQPEEAEAPADVETDSPEVVAAVEPVGEVEPGVATKVEVAPTEAVEVSAAVQLPAIIPAVNQGSPVEVETLAVDVEPPAVDVEPPAVEVETPAVEAAETTDYGMEAADTAAEAAPVSSETVEASGDISMVIGSSAIAALISELVDSTAEATTLAGSDVLENGDAATETGEAPPAGRTDGAEKPFANGETEASIKPDEQASSELTVAEASAAELEAALAKSAENTASAYKSRTRRRSSVSSVDSQDGESVSGSSAQIGVPSMNRLSILYEDSSRRLCFDAAVVEKVRIFREEGKIEVILSSAPEAGNPVKTEPSEGQNGTVDEKPFGERSKPSSLKGILVSQHTCGRLKLMKPGRDV
jgi:20S proteasome subunit alpha 6